jgi:hypothetical protein
MDTNWLPLTTDVAAAFVYNNRFSDFKQIFDPWLKWHISLVNKPDQHDQNKLISGSEVEKNLNVSLNHIQS